MPPRKDHPTWGGKRPRSGGAREGAGRKQFRLVLRLDNRLITRLQRIAERERKSPEAIAEAVVTGWIEQHNGHEEDSGPTYDD